MRWETLSCAEVKEPVGTVVAQSDRVCPDLLKNQCSAEPMVNRCAPGLFYRDHIGCVVLAWSPRGTARSHTLLNLERALEAQTILSCFLACILAWISIFRRPILPRSRLNPLFLDNLFPFDTRDPSLRVCHLPSMLCRWRCQMV